MIYKLCANIGGIKVIDMSINELDIVETMKTCVDLHSDIFFIITVQENKDSDEMFYKKIYDKESYDAYLQDFKERYMNNLKKCK